MVDLLFMISDIFYLLIFISGDLDYSASITDIPSGIGETTVQVPIVGLTL